MPLPENMNAKREELKAQEAEADAAGKPPVKVVPSGNAEIPPSKDGDRVNISREEFNELQAAKDRCNAAEGKSEAMKDDLEALQMRLTELEQAANGRGEGSPPVPAAAPPSAFQADLSEVEITEKEKADFEEDTIALINKIANNVFSHRSKKLVDELNNVRARLGEISDTATNAVKSSERVVRDAFTQKVVDKVAAFSNFDLIVKHKHWQDFVQSTNEESGDTYAALISRNVQAQRLEPMVRIFQKFYDKYVKSEGLEGGEYAGAIPTGNNDVDLGGGGKEILTLSSRKALHKKYINKEITFEEFQIEKKKFEIADSEGRLDYEH